MLCDMEHTHTHTHTHIYTHNTPYIWDVQYSLSAHRAISQAPCLVKTSILPDELREGLEPSCRLLSAVPARDPSPSDKTCPSRVA
jgi:hypothetical protein